ncbi:hypothetical protein AB0M02_17785 [Actinoplanes sp. NPDC051861]|uniref:hypothetical protein n=1 Tax=Actinoplanes sp. NPDC051861 TaxID=3155170 RepID=UPI00341905D9
MTEVPSPQSHYSKRWIWITVGSVMAVVLLCAGAFTIGSLGLQRLADSSDEHEPVKRELVEGLLAGHTKALKERNLEAFLAPFDPADKKLIAAQTRVFQNLVKIPFGQADFVRRSERNVTPLGAGYTLDLLVAFVHRIGGFDQTPIERPYFWKLVQDRKNGPLKITGVDRIPSGFNATSRDFYPTPWDKWDDIHVEQTEHVVQIVDSSLGAEARRHAAALEAAAVENLAAWKASGVDGQVPPGFVVSLVKGAKELGSLWRVTKEPPTEAGVSISMPSSVFEAADGPAIGGSRVVIDLRSTFFTDKRSGGPSNIFRHELAHSMTTVLTVGRNIFGADEMSNWVVEGFAEYMAYSGKSWTTSKRVAGAREELRRDRGEVYLPSNGLWESEGRLSYHYLLGHSAMSYIAEKYGEEKLFLFVAEHYRGKKDQIPQLLGVTQEEFQQQWADEFTKRMR